MEWGLGPHPRVSEVAVSSRIKCQIKPGGVICAGWQDTWQKPGLTVLPAATPKPDENSCVTHASSPEGQIPPEEHLERFQASACDHWPFSGFLQIQQWAYLSPKAADMGEVYMNMEINNVITTHLVEAMMKIWSFPKWSLFTHKRNVLPTYLGSQQWKARRLSD